MNEIGDRTDTLEFLGIRLGSLFLKSSIDVSCEGHNTITHGNGDSFIGNIAIKLQRLLNLLCDSVVRPRGFWSCFFGIGVGDARRGPSKKEDERE